MALLGAAAYDPAVEAEISTSSRAILTAFDTTNLRIAFVVPASGAVRVRICATQHGAASQSMSLFGVLQGSTVMGRAAARGRVGGTGVNTTFAVHEANFVVKGLTPGASLTWDAAVSTKVVFGFSALKWGGPDNATANDAFGAITYKISGA